MDILLGFKVGDPSLITDLHLWITKPRAGVNCITTFRMMVPTPPLIAVPEVTTGRRQLVKSELQLVQNEN